MRSQGSRPWALGWNAVGGRRQLYDRRPFHRPRLVKFIRTDPAGVCERICKILRLTVIRIRSGLSANRVGLITRPFGRHHTIPSEVPKLFARVWIDSTVSARHYWISPYSRATPPSQSRCPAEHLKPRCSFGSIAVSFDDHSSDGRGSSRNLTA